jgi:translation initiation factor IF-3
MRISHKKKKAPQRRVYFYDEKIIAPKVMVLNSEGENLGTFKTGEAIRLSHQHEMQLVLINPKTDPPVAKIMDFGQFRYQTEKDERKRLAHQHVVDLKGIRLSAHISQHDLDIRRAQTIKFLNDGDKVKIEIILKGRQNQLKPLARTIIADFIKTVNAEMLVRTEQQIEQQFNKITAIIAKQ